MQFVADEDVEPKCLVLRNEITDFTCRHRLLFPHQLLNLSCSAPITGANTFPLTHFTPV